MKDSKNQNPFLLKDKTRHSSSSAELTNEELGKLGESVVGLSFERIGEPFHHSEINGYGVDFTLLRSPPLIEVKNWSGKYPVTPELARREILTRFDQSDPQHRKPWVLAISKLWPGRETRQLLASHGITIVEWGCQVTSHSKRRIKKSVKVLVNRLKALFRFSFSLSKGQVFSHYRTLSHYIVPLSQWNTDHASYRYLKPLLPHDELKQNPLKTTEIPLVDYEGKSGSFLLSLIVPKKIDNDSPKEELLRLAESLKESNPGGK